MHVSVVAKNACNDFSRMQRFDGNQTHTRVPRNSILEPLSISGALLARCGRLKSSSQISPRVAGGMHDEFLSAKHWRESNVYQNKVLNKSCRFPPALQALLDV